MSGYKKARLDLVHADCGGMVITSLDGDECGRCGAELTEDDWRESEPSLYNDADRGYDLWAFAQDYGSAP